MQIVLTVLFESPFWVGVFERQEQGEISVARVVFGSEPTSPELLHWILERYAKLEFSRGSKTQILRIRALKPKRATREAKRAALQTGVSSLAQETMRLELESRQLERKEISKQEREAQAERQYQLRKAKAKARHRGK